MSNQDPSPKPAHWSERQERAFQALEAQRQVAAQAPAQPPKPQSQTHPVRKQRGPAINALRWVLLAALLGALVFSTGWPTSLFKDDEIDNVFLERQILNWAKGDRVDYQAAYGSRPVEVSCPTGIAVEPGRDFDCILTLEDDTTLGVSVSIQNDAGEVTWGLG